MAPKPDKDAAALANDKARLTNETTRLTNETTQLNNEKLRREIETLGATKAVELKTAKLANEKTKSDLDQSRRKDLGDALVGGVPKLSELKTGSLTVSEGAVFKQQDMSVLALEASCATLSADMVKLFEKGAKRVILVTSNSDLLRAMLTYWEVGSRVKSAIESAGSSKASVNSLIEEAESQILAVESEPDETEITTPNRTLAPAAAAAVVPAIGAAIREALSLAELDIDIHVSSRTTTAFETHMALLSALRSALPEATIRHDTVALPNLESSLLAEVGQLSRLATELDTAVKKIETILAALGERATPIPSLAYRLNLAATEGRAAIAQLGVLVTWASSAAGESTATPLSNAMLWESAASDAVTHVLVAPPATLAADQVAVRRRIFGPKLISLAHARLEHALIETATGDIVLAGSSVGKASIVTKFRFLDGREPKMEQAAL